MEAKERIRAFVNENLVPTNETVTFKDDDNIFERGFVNSLFAMKLLNFVENEFNIIVENEEMDMANFSSVDNINNLIQSKILN